MIENPLPSLKAATLVQVAPLSSLRWMPSLREDALQVAPPSTVSALAP